MNPSHSSPSKRRPRAARLAAEALEPRELMTGGGGDTFAIIPGAVAKGGDVTAVKFTIDAAHFKAPNGKITLGIDIAPDNSGTLQPKIVGVSDSSGHRYALTHGVYDPSLQSVQTTVGRSTTAVLATLPTRGLSPTTPLTFEVDVRGLRSTSGKFLLGFFLPGDADGNGKVEQADVNAVNAILNSKAGDQKYNFDADANRDGRINRADLMATEKNLGVSVTISPVASANLDPAGVIDVSQRITRNNSAKFTGNLTPDATVTFTDASGKNKPVTTKADAQGNYSLTVPLSEGSNTFKVSTQDAFGQSISGTLAPVNYSSAPVVTPATVMTGGVSASSKKS